MLVANLGLDDIVLEEEEVVGWGVPFEETDVAPFEEADGDGCLPWEQGVSSKDKVKSMGPVLSEVDSGLTEEQQIQLWALLGRYSTVFAQRDNELGRSDLVEHRIEVQGPPIRQPFRRQPPGHRAEEQR